MAFVHPTDPRKARPARLDGDTLRERLDELSFATAITFGEHEPLRDPMYWR
jgi:hypothetical protein